MTADIVVIGSINIDLVVQAERAPEAGETLDGQLFTTVPGGKGANQAAAAAKLGASVAMVGRVGADDFGRDLCQKLAGFNVDTSHLQVDEDQPTGTALIIVESSGENRILIVAGANGKVSKQDVDQASDLISRAKLIVLQMEIPLETIKHALNTASTKKIPVLLNLAPAKTLDQEYLQKITYLVVNETEAQFLTGIKVIDKESARKAGRKMIEIGVRAALITMGGLGVVFLDQDQDFYLPGLKVDVIDTTAAGDAFIGGFAAGLAANRSLRDAVRYANTAGALATTKLGAQPSLPTLEEVQTRLLQEGLE